jgi:hypothetical protein
VATSILHVFFATGELKYIDLYYQCMGHEVLSASTRRVLMSAFTNTKALFREELVRLEMVDRVGAGSIHEYVRSLGLRMDALDFTYFDDIVERANDMKAQAAELRAIVGADNVVSQ